MSSDDFADAQVDFVPLSLRDVKLQKSDVAWADIGGNYCSASSSTIPDFLHRLTEDEASAPGDTRMADEVWPNLCSVTFTASLRVRYVCQCKNQ